MKLIDKYNDYLSIIHEKQRQYVNDTVVDLPEFLYSVYPNGEISIKTVGSPYYYDPKIFKKEKVTKLDLYFIKNYSYNLPEFSSSQIYIPYFEITSIGKSSSAVKYSDMNFSFMTKQTALIKSIEVKEKIEAEKILLENDYSRCQYCKKVYPNSQKVTKKMHSIYTYGREGKWMSFCSGTCSMHNQMSLEG